MGKNGLYGNSAETHGYAWSDGTVRSYPEPGMRIIDRRPTISVHETPAVPHVTQDTLDKAYAAWLKDYTAWKKRMAEWEAKYGKKV